MPLSSLTRLGQHAATTAARYRRKSGFPLYYMMMKMARARYHVSATEVRRDDVRSQVRTLVQAPHAQQQYFIAPDLSAHGRAHPTEIVRALTSEGVPQSNITMIWAVAQAVASSMGTMQTFLREFTDLRGVLVVRGSTPADARAVLTQASTSAVASLEPGGGPYAEACQIVKASNHKLGLVLNPYSPYPRFMEEMAYKLRFRPEFVFTQPVFDPYCINPQIRAYIERLAIQEKIRLSVGVINATPKVVSGRMHSDSDSRVQPSGVDRYILPPLGEEEELDAYNQRNQAKTLAWVRDKLGGGADSVYVRSRAQNQSVFTYLEGTVFDCRVVTKPGVPLLKL